MINLSDTVTKSFPHQARAVWQCRPRVSFLSISYCLVHLDGYTVVLVYYWLVLVRSRSRICSLRYSYKVDYEEKNNLVVANQTESLRTTVPNMVVELFELECGSVGVGDRHQGESRHHTDCPNQDEAGGVSRDASQALGAGREAPGHIRKQEAKDMTTLRGW